MQKRAQTVRRRLIERPTSPRPNSRAVVGSGDAIPGASRVGRCSWTRPYPALSRHEIAAAQGEAIQLRWENEMKQAADELQAILNARSDDDGECVAN